MKKKACKRCKLFVEEASCPICKNNQFSTNWQGRLIILDPEHSIIANNIGAKKEGEYAIKVR